MAHSTAQRPKQKATKPDKPNAKFPLFAHATRRWAKKIRGKLHYFGPWDKPDEALDLFLLQKDELYAGRKPRVSHDTYTVADLCEDFMCSRERRLNDGEITARTFHDYHTVCQRIVKHFGRNRAVDDLGPEDFGELRQTLGTTWGPTTVANEIQRVRVVFNFGYKQKKLDRPVAFGEEFRRPPKKVLRRTRRKNGKRMLEAAELRQVIAKAKQPMRAMILLAANGGLGQSDLSALPLRTLEEAIETGWLDYARPKTEVERRFPLWPETVAACKEALDKRPKPAGNDEAGLAFVTRLGAAWVKSRTKVDLDDEGEEKPETRRLIVEDAVGREFAKLLNDLGIKRLGVNFYAIRHGFETVAGDSRDQVAVNHVMGHADASMAAEYRETVADERLQNVVDVVHVWLFAQ